MTVKAHCLKCGVQTCRKYASSVAVIWAFLQDKVDKGKGFSTIKGYLAVISTCHVGFEGKVVWQHPSGAS